MKRSAQVALMLMSAASVGGINYALSTDCRQGDPNAVADDAQSSVCRSTNGSHSHYGSGRGWGLFSGTGSSGPGTTTSFGSAINVAAVRGGFGSTGRGMASGGS
jgi:hypothetical protein